MDGTSHETEEHEKAIESFLESINQVDNDD